jgi:hypothetical protein
MTEELREILGDFKIWKNPSRSGEAVAYLGSYRPPDGQIFFTLGDLQELGFGPRDYTVLPPEESRHAGLFSKWQTVTVPSASECG